MPDASIKSARDALRFCFYSISPDALARATFPGALLGR
jgi:hypothetical protein